MIDGSKADKPRLQSIRRHLDEKGLPESVKNVADYVSLIRKMSELWQKEDWNRTEQDDEVVLNNARLVGQAWFRGHSDCTFSLRPGLYREGTRQYLNKLNDSPKPLSDVEGHLLSELFDLEHEERVDFTSYGHLLNEANEAKTAIDWYFLMQHHGIPTRLLDWTANALAALFFSLDAYRRRLEDVHRLCPNRISDLSESAVAVWMIDAYWLADHLSDVWSGPLLPWSEDSAKYIPPLERLIDKMSDAKALLPRYAMPIEPPAMHPRVASQEGRFIIFGQTQDLLDEEIRLDQNDDCTIEELRVTQIRFEIDDVESILRDLAQLGVSRRTLFPDLAGLADFVRWKHFHKVRTYPA